MHPHHSHVLQLDIQGTPQAWISLEHAALHVATGSVAWVDGDGPLATLRGGFNVARGRQSVIDVHPIIALHGASGQPVRGGAGLQQGQAVPARPDDLRVLRPMLQRA
jgi:hypothetical protein